MCEVPQEEEVANEEEIPVHWQNEFDRVVMPYLPGKPSVERHHV